RARRGSPAERFGRWCRRNPGPASLTAAVGLLLALGGGGGSVGYVGGGGVRGGGGCPAGGGRGGGVEGNRRGCGRKPGAPGSPSELVRGQHAVGAAGLGRSPRGLYAPAAEGGGPPFLAPGDGEGGPVVGMRRGRLVAPGLDQRQLGVAQGLGLAL